jgi:fructose-1,6-bisphosphatase
MEHAGGKGTDGAMNILDIQVFNNLLQDSFFKVLRSHLL